MFLKSNMVSPDVAGTKRTSPKAFASRNEAQPRAGAMPHPSAQVVLETCADFLDSECGFSEACRACFGHHRHALSPGRRHLHLPRPGGVHRLAMLEVRGIGHDHDGISGPSEGLFGHLTESEGRRVEIHRKKAWIGLDYLEMLRTGCKTNCVAWQSKVSSFCTGQTPGISQGLRRQVVLATKGRQTAPGGLKKEIWADEVSGRNFL